jgi:lysyl-tRNA synthetase class II
MAENKIYVQGSYIDIHDNENVYLSVDKASVNVNENTEQARADESLLSVCRAEGVSTEGQNQNENLPEVLANSELWERVKDEGLVDENNMPTTSRPEAALLADMLAEKLGIGNKWKLFEKLWNRKNMRNDYNTALEQRKSLKFQEKLKNILG